MNNDFRDIQRYKMMMTTTGIHAIVAGMLLDQLQPPLVRETSGYLHKPHTDLKRRETS